MPEQDINREEFADSLLPVFEQLLQEQRLVPLRGGIVAAAGDALADVLRAQIADAEAAIAGIEGSQVLLGLLGASLSSVTGDRLEELKAVLADVMSVQAELRARPAPSATSSLSQSCPRCGNPPQGGLCTRCQSHDRFVEDDRLAYAHGLAEREYRRAQDDYLRDQKSHFDVQDTWQDT